MHSAWNFLQVNARLSKPSGMALIIMLSRISFDIRERAIVMFVEWRDADEHIDGKAGNQASRRTETAISNPKFGVYKICIYNDFGFSKNYLSGVHLEEKMYQSMSALLYNLPSLHDNFSVNTAIQSKDSAVKSAFCTFDQMRY